MYIRIVINYSNFSVPKYNYKSSKMLSIIYEIEL